jgi:hypothetical protein
VDGRLRDCGGSPPARGADRADRGGSRGVSVRSSTSSATDEVDQRTVAAAPSRATASRCA